MLSAAKHLAVAKHLVRSPGRPFAEFTLERSEGLRVTAPQPHVRMRVLVRRCGRVDGRRPLVQHDRSLVYVGWARPLQAVHAKTVIGDPAVERHDGGDFAHDVAWTGEVKMAAQLICHILDDLPVRQAVAGALEANAN